MSAPTITVRGLVLTRDGDGDFVRHDVVDGVERRLLVGRSRTRDGFLASVSVYSGGGGYTGFQAEDGSTPENALEAALRRAEQGMRDLHRVVAAYGSITAPSTSEVVAAREVAS